MGLLVLPYGPWKIIFEGTWLAHNVSLYENDEKVFLLLLYEKSLKEGALVLLKKAFLVEGDATELSSFLKSQKRAMTLFQRSSRENAYAFLLIEGNPVFVRAGKNVELELSKAIREQYGFLNSVTNGLLNVASSYNAKITELSKTNEETTEFLVGDPLLLLSFKPKREAQEKIAGETITFPLGADNSGENVLAGLSSLEKTVCLGESIEKRLHALHVLSENALLNNVSCFIYTSFTPPKLAGLAKPSNAVKELEGVEGKPQGFPVDYLDNSSMTVDLKIVGAQAFIKAFGLNDEGIENALTKAFENASSLEDVENNLNAQEILAPVARKTLRVIKLIEKNYPHAFKKDELKVLSKAIEQANQKSLAKVYFIQLPSDKSVKTLLACNAIKFLTQTMKTGENDFLNALVVMEDDYGSLDEETKECLNKLSEKKIGFAIHARHASDASEVKPTLEIELLEKDVVVTEKGVKTRLKIRPAQSYCTEKTV